MKLVTQPKYKHSSVSPKIAYTEFRFSNDSLYLAARKESGLFDYFTVKIFQKMKQKPKKFNVDREGEQQVKGLKKYDTVYWQEAPEGENIIFYAPTFCISKSSDGSNCSLKFFDFKPFLTEQEQKRAQEKEQKMRASLKRQVTNQN